jgi:Tol biopolymer transport system component
VTGRSPRADRAARPTGFPAPLGVLTALALALAPGAAPAETVGSVQYDPAFRWHTLTTPHFEIHFHQGEEALAQRVALVAERAHLRLVPLLGHEPTVRTQVVLSDDVDDANGSATPLPRNIIRLYAVPPESDSVLQDSRDWLTELVEHEYVHILQLDSVSGAPALVNTVLGKVWMPNLFTPTWLIEGLAVAHEGEDAGTGRNASALFDMYARALTLEPPGLPGLEVVTNQPLEWPRGNDPYLLGGRFVQFLLQRNGQEALRHVVADQGGQIIPWAPNWAAERWLGADFPALWQEFRASLERRYQAQLAAIRARPVTQPKWLTHRGGTVSRPRWTPDGAALVYLDHGPEERGGLRRVTADGVEQGRVLPVDLHGAFALRSADEAVVSKGQVWHEFRVYDDLWLADLRRGTERRLTDGERATDPDLVPDGSAVVYVARSGGGELELRRRLVAGGPAERLLWRPGTQLYDPAVASDGRRIALSVKEGGRRDLWLLESEQVTRLTDDDAIDMQPAWTPDGRWLLFASDRGGVFNLHAWSSETGVIRQVTNVESGAMDPAVSPDGRTIAFVGYGRTGYDLATIPFDPSTWLDEAPAAAAAPPSIDLQVTPPPPIDLQATPPPPTSAPYPATPYSPSTALPTFWLPVWAYDSTGTTLGAFTTSADVVGLHTWQAQGWWSQGFGTFGYAASYVGGWSWPALDLLSERVLGGSPGYPARDMSEWTPLAGGLTFSFTQLERALQLRLGWSATRYQTLGDPGSSAGIPPEYLFADGTLSEAALGIAYSDARRYTWSISSEEGRQLSLRLRLAGKETGSDYTLWRARAAWSEYLRLPGTRHVVVATRLSGALGHGSLGGSPPFTLGGVSSANLVDLFLLQTFSASDQLRGYPAGGQAGNGIALANLELRFPLATPEVGHSTWPLFLRRVHGAVFADLGEAFVHGEERGYTGSDFRWDRLRLGVGAELRLELVMAYWLVGDLRLGVARGLGRPFRGESPSQDPLAELQWYVTFGPSF